MSKSNIDSFVALGDSFTEGLWDFRPDGTLRGWADLVAEQLAVNVPDFRYANLAVRGRKLDEVADDQVPQLERLKPSLVALGAGANDIIRTKVSPPELGNRFRRLLGQVSDVSDQVVVFAGFDPLAGSSRLGSKEPYRHPSCISQRCMGWRRWPQQRELRLRTGRQHVASSCLKGSPC